MQVTSLLNIAASAAAIAALGAGKVAKAPETLNGLPGQNTGSLADALITAQTASPEQFASLLTGVDVKGSPLLANEVTATDKQDKTADSPAVAWQPR